ncbi:putative PHD finger-like domain-containing protein 5B-like isoform X1 [Raphanus sativus]|nr:putative PHD finger-like domain-containing protein 5B-like isoform X1 [Raphanus sativus]
MLVNSTAVSSPLISSLGAPGSHSSLTPVTPSSPPSKSGENLKRRRLVSAAMAKHHPDLIMCRKQPGIAIGRLCEKCDGKCVVCDSYVRPCTLVRICDECNYGSFQGRCVICGGVGISDAYYCKECTQQEKDRDGCPKIVNLGSAKTDLFYERKKYGFKKR